MYKLNLPKLPILIIGRVDVVFATETVNSGRFPVGSNQRLEKFVFTATLFNAQQWKGTLFNLHRVW